MIQNQNECVTHRNAFGDLRIVLLVLKQILRIMIPNEAVEDRVDSVEAVSFVIRSTRTRSHG